MIFHKQIEYIFNDYKSMSSNMNKDMEHQHQDKFKSNPQIEEHYNKIIQNQMAQRVPLLTQSRLF